MIYNGTDFNTEWVRSLTKKQFVQLGALGNKLTKEQLEEFYDIEVPKIENKKVNENSKFDGKGSKRN